MSEMCKFQIYIYYYGDYITLIAISIFPPICMRAKFYTSHHHTMTDYNLIKWGDKDNN